MTTQLSYCMTFYAYEKRMQLDQLSPTSAPLLPRPPGAVQARVQETASVRLALVVRGAGPVASGGPSG